MTSRVSFAKLCKMTIKNHISSLLILCLTFVIHFIAYFMQYQNIVEYALEYRNQEYLLERLASLSSPGTVNGLFALGVGIFLAYDYFKYMHSKKETDFYEALPITRSKRFRMIFVCCSLLFTGLCFITLGLELIVVSVSGYASFEITRCFLWNFICMTLSFFASFVTASLAMIMTGHPIVAALGYGIFSSYFAVILKELFPNFAGEYFDSYVRMPVFGFLKDTELLYCLSPVTLMATLTSDWSEKWLIKDHLNYFIAICIFIIVVGFIAFQLFIRRESESAGRAMAFEKANSVIRFFITIPFALYIGLFLKQVSSSNTSEIWMIFGILFGGFLVHGIMECIYQFDIKALFTKRKQLLFTYVIAFTFIAIFKFDLMKFDNYVPNAEKVTCVKINSNSMNYAFNDYFYEAFEADGISDPNTILLALEAIEDVIGHSLADSFSYENTDNIDVTYTMKNGTQVFRSYCFNMDQIPESLNKLSVTREFKDDVCSLYTADIHEFKELKICRNILEYQSITGNQLDVFVENYLKDITNMSFTELYNNHVKYLVEGNIYLEEFGYDENYSFYVYEGFEHTIAFIESLDTETSTSNVSEIFLEIYPDKDDDEYVTTTIHDLDKLIKMKNHIYWGYSYRNYPESWRQAGISLQIGTTHLYYDVYIDMNAVKDIL